MKKIVLLFAAVVFTAFSAKLFAQTNTGVYPSVGSTHYYWVNSGDNGASQEAGHAGNSYKWWVASKTDLNTALEEGTDFSLAGGAYDVATTDSFAIGLTWNPSAVGDTFFVVVEETDPNGNLCSNIKAQAVVPVNNFEVQFVALDESGATGDSLSRCAPDISLSASGLTVTYNYGVDTVMFKVSATGIYSGWSLTNAFDLTALNAPFTNVEYQIGGGSWTTNVSTINVAANETGSEEVYFRVALDNQTSNDGTDEQTIKLTLTDVTDGANNAVITDNTGDDISSDATQTQTIKARIATSGIGTDE